MKELLKGNTTIDEVIKKNLEELLVKMNKIRTTYNKPMTVTSGLRTKEDQLRIYRARGVADDKIPMGSAHLKGAACDILDLDGSLMKWCRDNVKTLEEVGLWIEDDTSVPRVHFQTYSPKSGNRFFKP
jgi:uncharacterized protein YcbK (DUF882 family)